MRALNLRAHANEENRSVPVFRLYEKMRNSRERKALWMEKGYIGEKVAERKFSAQRLK